jgi:hypothetical protein
MCAEGSEAQDCVNEEEPVNGALTSFSSGGEPTQDITMI